MTGRDEAMPRRKPTPESEQSIPEMVDELTRQEIATWYKDGKLTPHGREMAKFLDRACPAEKVDVVARISPWNMQHHVDYIKYFIYQYYLSCSELHIATLPASQQEEARQGWTKILRPFKCREPWLCPARG